MRWRNSRAHDWTVALLRQAVRPGHPFACRAHRRRHLQEVVLVRAIGLWRTVDHLDGCPGFPPPALTPQNAGLVLRHATGAAFANKSSRRQDIDHAATHLRIDG